MMKKDHFKQKLLLWPQLFQSSMSFDQIINHEISYDEVFPHEIFYNFQIKKKIATLRIVAKEKLDLTFILIWHLSLYGSSMIWLNIVS